MGHTTRKLLRILILTVLFGFSWGQCRFDWSHSKTICWKKYDFVYLRELCPYYYDGTFMTCQNLKGDLHEMQERYRESIEGIQVFNSSITEIRAETFRNLKKLTYLTLDHTNISVIQLGAFSDLVDLRDLHMTNNAIGALPNHVFNTLTKLEVLDLSHNKIKYMTSDSFPNMSSIQELYLNNNELSDISFLIDNCNSLHYLDISYNRIEHFPLTGCTVIVILRIGGNPMKNLDGNLFKNWDLKHLDVSNIGLSSINADLFRHLSSLQYLNLSQNPLFKTDPIRVDLFKNMKHLKYLGLSSTFLQELSPGTLTSFLGLEELDLSFNNLTYLPKHEGAEKLNLNHNRLTNFEFDGVLYGVFLDNNLLSCATLMSLLQKYSYRIKYGNTYNTTNIKGVACQNLIDSPPNSHTSSASMNVLIRDYLTEFVHEQQDISEEFDKLKYLIGQRNRNMERFSQDYLKKLRRALFLRNASLYCISFASLLAIIVGVLCHRRSGKQNKILEQRNLSSNLEI